MYWNDDSDKAAEYKVPDDIVDVNFKIKCTHLPLDHAYDLSTAIMQELPWAKDDERVGIHLIHGAESGNGWIRPSGPDDLIYPSRRTLFSIRTPQERRREVEQLAGRTIKIGDIPVELSRPSVRGLSKITTLFARYVLAQQIENEDLFLQEMADLLAQKQIAPRKMMSGRATLMRFPEGVKTARSLMIDGIEVAESVRLQQQGLGAGRKIGCGIFLPHKGIDPVNEAQEK